MKCRAGITFEFALRQPITLNIDCVEAGSPHTIAGRALKQAKKTLKPVNWCSAVVVLERLSADGTLPRLDGPELEAGEIQNVSPAPESVLPH